MMPGLALNVVAMTDSKQVTTPDTAYEADFYGWTQNQARLLRALRPGPLDWANVAEEIGSLGRSDRREIARRLYMILDHLLKWKAQPAQRKSGWRGTLFEQRHGIAKLLAESPSLRSYPRRVLDEEYRAAVVAAANETGLPESGFPKACPFTVDQILGENFWQEGA
jgi:hypothetical protein